jgi:hypothetical protein
MTGSYVTPEVAPSPDEKPLWQLGLDWLCDCLGDSDAV